MNKKNKILGGIFLLAAIVSAGLYFKVASKYDKYRAQINDTMKDPGSTEFKNEAISSNKIYCAETNSKNGYGAYVGFERVMAQQTNVALGRGGEGYVFFEREGLDGNGAETSLLQLKILVSAKETENSARERRIFARSDEAILSEEEYKKIAMRKVFEKEWFKNCSLEINEVVPDAATQVDKKPPPPPLPPMPNNGEPDQYANQGWSCKKGFIQIENLCQKNK